MFMKDGITSRERLTFKNSKFKIINDILSAIILLLIFTLGGMYV